MTGGRRRNSKNMPMKEEKVCAGSSQREDKAREVETKGEKDGRQVEEVRRSLSESC